MIINITGTIRVEKTIQVSNDFIALLDPDGCDYEIVEKLETLIRDKFPELVQIYGIYDSVGNVMLEY